MANELSMFAEWSNKAAGFVAYAGAMLDQVESWAAALRGAR
jgi:hypothetical protein